MKSAKPRRSHVVLLASIAALVTSEPASAQLTLTGTNYLESFDTIAAGLPTGWSVRTGANSTALGTTATLTTTATDWANTSGAFKNFASATGLTSAASAADQSGSTDRALGIRQTGAVGDPGASFNLQLANTAGLSNFSLSLDLEMLSVQTRSTTWSVQYGIGASPSTWSTIHTYADPGVFGTTAATNLSFGGALNNLTDNVWIRVVALSASTGSGSRDSFGIDQFSLSWESALAALYWDTNGSTPGIGGSGVWNTADANWSTAATGDVAPTQFTSANPVIFGGIGGTVTIDAGGVTAQGGLRFDSEAYTVEGNKLTLASVSTINTTHAAGTVTTVASEIGGTAGLTKAGPGTLALGTANTFEGQVTIGAGAIEISQATNLGADGNDVSFGGGKLIATESINFAGTRDLSGGGAIEVASGKTLTVLGSTNLTSLALTGPGTVALEGATRTVGTIAIAAPATLTSAAGSITASEITTTHTSGTATIAADLNFGGVLRTVNVADGSADVDLELSGALTLTGGSNFRLHKLGAGTLRLSGDNSGLAGSVRIGTAGGTPAAGGTIVIDNKNSLGNATGIQIQFNDGVLRAENELIFGDAIPLGLSIGAGQGVPATFAGADMEFTGVVQLFKAGSTYQHAIRVENTTMFAGNFTASTGSGTSTGLTISGPGTLILAGSSNTIAEQITLDGPKLQLFGALTAGVTVDGGTLSGVGTIAGNSSVTEGGFLAPGADVGTLTFGGNLDISSAIATVGSGSLLFNLDTTATSDQVALTAGVLTIGSGLDFEDFAFLTAGNLQPGAYTLFATTQTISGTFAPLEGLVDGFTTNIALSPDGTDIVLNVVPEPGAATFLLGGLGLMAARRRRR